MSRKPELSHQFNPIRQAALELRLRAELGQPLEAEKALELSASLDAAIDAISASVIKARNALTYGADYDPLA